MTDWIVRRWTRFGHDRLYASTPGGTDLGYLDLATGRFHSDDLTNLPLLRKAIEDHLGTREPVRVPDVEPTQRATTPAPPMPVTPSTAPSGLGVGAPTGPPAGSPTGLTTGPPAGAAREWHDLANVRAGAAARERALAEREEQGLARHLFARLVDARTEERSWRIGADGEEAVAAQLAKLGAEWRILHAVRVGSRGADIDHVVIGPGGVFTVNAKHHPKASVWVGGETFMVNGRREPYVRASRFEAKRASRLLAEHVGFPVSVTGVVAVVGARRGFTVKGQPADGAVVVVSQRAIGGFLRAQPRRLGLREIDAIHEVARRSTTWQR